MENKSIYPSVSQKIQGQSCLLQSNFQDSRAISHGMMPNLQWRGNGALLPAPCLGKVSSSSVKPMPITIEAPAEKRTSQLSFFVQSSVLTLLAPIQRVQLLLQNQNAIINSGRLSHPYNGILNCFSRTIRNEGFFSLWRGNGAHIMAILTREITSSYRANALASTDLKEKDPLTRKLVDFFAIVASSLLVHPFTYAEIRLANDVISTTSQRQFSGVIDVWRKTLMTDGILGIYRGWSIRLVAAFANSMIVKSILPAIKPRSISFQSNLEAIQAYLDVALATLATYPMHTVSRRMMMSSGEGETAKYKNTRDAFSRILKKEGLKSFYKGGGAEILRFTMAYCLVVAPAVYIRIASTKKIGE